jgi:hypothetical protein
MYTVESQNIFYRTCGRTSSVFFFLENTAVPPDLLIQYLQFQLSVVYHSPKKILILKK